MASVHGIHVIGGSVPLESGDPAARLRRRCSCTRPAAGASRATTRSTSSASPTATRTTTRRARFAPGAAPQVPRRAARQGGPVDLLRRALPGALSRARRPHADRRARRLHRAHRRARTGTSCCARARSRTSATCSRPPRAASTKAAAARTATPCWSTRGARSSPARTRARVSWSGDIDDARAMRRHVRARALAGAAHRRADGVHRLERRSAAAQQDQHGAAAAGVARRFAVGQHVVPVREPLAHLALEHRLACWATSGPCRGSRARSAGRACAPRAGSRRARRATPRC